MFLELINKLLKYFGDKKNEKRQSGKEQTSQSGY